MKTLPPRKAPGAVNMSGETRKKADALSGSGRRQKGLRLAYAVMFRMEPTSSSWVRMAVMLAE